MLHRRIYLTRSNIATDTIAAFLFIPRFDTMRSTIKRRFSMISKPSKLVFAIQTIFQQTFTANDYWFVR